MRITALRGWHWLVVGLLAGLACGAARDAAINFADELDGYGQRLGQREFERAVVADLHGRRRFDRLAVYPYRLAGSSAANAVRVHVVAGLYCDGQPREENGRLALRWEPAYFVAAVPYQPVTTTATTTAAASASPVSYPDVLAYLQSLSPKSPGGRGVTFRYESWAWAARPPFLWGCGVFLFVGVVWPTVINLLAYGRLTRPPEPKGISLRDVRRPAAAAPPAEAAPDLSAVRALDEELEAAVASAPTPAATVSTAPVRSLATSPVEAADVAPGSQKHFGARREDYYPTELGAKHED